MQQLVRLVLDCLKEVIILKKDLIDPSNIQLWDAVDAKIKHLGVGLLAFAEKNCSDYIDVQTEAFAIASTENLFRSAFGDTTAFDWRC